MSMTKTFFKWNKKIWKICMIFDIESRLWKSDLGIFWRPVWKSVKKFIHLELIFSNKSTPSWLLSSKLHHRGHANVQVLNWFFSLLGTIAIVMGTTAMLPHVTRYNATASMLIPIIAEGMEQPGTTWEHFLYWHVLHLLLFHHREKHCMQS